MAKHEMRKILCSIDKQILEENRRPNNVIIDKRQNQLRNANPVLKSTITLRHIAHRITNPFSTQAAQHTYQAQKKKKKSTLFMKKADKSAVGSNLLSAAKLK